MIGCAETLERINRALMTGEAFVRLYDEHRFPVATADEQVATFCCGVDSTLLLEKTT